MLSFEDAIEFAKRKRPSLVAVDGLPCSGKSTLADRLLLALDGECIALDDFLLPERAWPPLRRPAFPFEYIRYGQFLSAVRDLALNGECAFSPFDWSTCEISPAARRVDLKKPVVVEGVSALNPEIAGLFDLRIFVESDRTTTLEVAIGRAGGGPWIECWHSLFLPSVDLYMLSSPRERADLVVSGRGIATASRRAA